MWKTYETMRIITITIIIFKIKPKEFPRKITRTWVCHANPFEIPKPNMRQPIT